jgi:hypothetical protein
VAYWMKDVLQDLEQFCEENRLEKIQHSIGQAAKVLDEEIRLREEMQLADKPNMAKTSG